MNTKKYAEEFFEIIIGKHKNFINMPLECSKGEFGTLLYLVFINKDVTPSKLCEEIGVSLPRMTTILNALETKKLIEKTINSSDKRKIIINITKEGKDLVLKKREEAINNIIKIIEKLDEEEIKEYIKIAKKISNIMNEV